MDSSTDDVEEIEIIEIKDSKYPEILSLIEEVENTNQNSIEIDIFSLQEEGISALNSVTNCLNSLTENSTVLGENLNKRTKEINIINNIKDIYQENLIELRNKNLSNRIELLNALVIGMVLALFASAIGFVINNFYVRKNTNANKV